MDAICLRSDAILATLRTRRIGKSLLVLEECASTNDVAEKAASEGALLILEAMKMQNEIASPVSEHVKSIRVKEGDTVKKDTGLIVLE